MCFLILGGWKSSAVAERYLEESIETKKKSGRLISSLINPIPSGRREVARVVNVPQLLRKTSREKWCDLGRSMDRLNVHS